MTPGGGRSPAPGARDDPRQDPRDAVRHALDLARPPIGDGGTTARETRLVRHGSNAVFALGDVIIRVAPDDALTRITVDRSLRVANWLADENFPSARVVHPERLAVPQPVEVDGYLVTFWESLGDASAHGSTGDLGRLLRRFHALTLPPQLRPEPLDPVGRIRHQLGGADFLGGDDRASLLRSLDDLTDRYAAVDLPLPPGHLHGDATVANVVLDRAGRPTLIDLDLLRTGPREWDLLRTAVYARRLGWHTDEEYRGFVDAYGVDVAAYRGFDTLADLCELLQVAWLARAAADRPALRAELGVRLASLRTGGTRRTWRAV